MNLKKLFTIIFIGVISGCEIVYAKYETGIKRTRIPVNEDSRKLAKAFNNLSKAEWPLPGELPVLKQSDSSSSVIRLKNYLKATGDLTHVNKRYLSSPVFDDRLADAVKNFQSRNGLEADGIAGKNTIEKMNVPLSYRLNQLQVNLARLKALPEDFGERYIVVNIPAYSLEYYENNKPAITMNVVVGTIENYTPVLQDTMSYIVFNPTWNVPVSIVTKEMIPELKKEVGYLEKNNYILLKGSYNSKDTIDPKTVNWNEVNAEKLPFSIVQKSGKNNALGRIKFMFPNNFDVYLHDTPSGQAFKLEKRDFSHGCIRLEKPKELAEILLKGQMEQAEISEILAEDETRNVKLDKKVVVHLLYQTAWVDDEGRLQLRDDIYEIDKSAMQQ